MRIFRTRRCLSMSSSRQAYVLPSDSIADSTRKLCYGKIRRGNFVLLRTIEGLNEQEEICKRRHRDEKSDLKQIIHHLNYQREGLSSLGSIIAGDAHRLASSRGMQAESDCRQIKSIRRPLAPETTRDHGSRPVLRPNLQSKEGSVIPRAVEREILKRQTMRLKTKNQERLECLKQREMQLEDMVGVYTRINIVKGSFNYNEKSRHSTDETKINDAYTTYGWKDRYNSSSVEAEQAADSLSTKEAGWEMPDRTSKVFLTNASKLKVVPSIQAKAKEVSSRIPKQTRNNVKRRLALSRVKNVVHEVPNSEYKDSENWELEHSEGHKVLPCEELEENRKGTFEKISARIDALEEISDEVNDIKTRENVQEFATVTSEKTATSSGEASGENGAKIWACTVKNKVLLPLRFRQETLARRGSNTDLQASDRNRWHSYVKDSDSITKANKREETSVLATEEHNAAVEEKPNPLSAGKLQKLIREKVLSQSQKSIKRTNKKSALLADCMRTLQKHMGFKDEELESSSPDFSETPFIAAEKKFGCEDEQGKEPRAVDRRL